MCVFSIFNFSTLSFCLHRTRHVSLYMHQSITDFTSNVEQVTIRGETQLTIDSSLRLEGFASLTNDVKKHPRPVATTARAASSSVEYSWSESSSSHAKKHPRPVATEARAASSFEYSWSESSGRLDFRSPLVRTDRSNRNLVIDAGLLQVGQVYVRFTSFVFCRAVRL